MESAILQLSQGHTISNLDMKFAGMTGLFSFIFGGKVTNLIITNSSFTNISTYNDVEETDGALLYTGSIAAFNIGEITNCHVFGTNSEYDIFYGKAFDNITDGTVVGAGKNMGYDVFVKAGIENGTVTVDKKEADVDETVTITLTADEGCRLKSVTVEKVATTGQADSRAAVPGIGDFVEPTDNVQNGKKLIIK